MKQDLLPTKIWQALGLTQEHQVCTTVEADSTYIFQE